VPINGVRRSELLQSLGGLWHPRLNVQLQGVGVGCLALYDGRSAFDGVTFEWISKPLKSFAVSIRE